MNTYKNLEIYQTAFNLAIQVYRLNVMLSARELQNHGNKLRWVSLRIKDMIAESFSDSRSDKEYIRALIVIEKQNDEVLILLKRIRKGNKLNRQIPELIRNYGKLKNKVREHIQNLNTEKYDYVIQFPESVMMDMAG